MECGICDRLLDGLCRSCLWALYMDFVWTLDYVVYTILEEVFLVN